MSDTDCAIFTIVQYRDFFDVPRVMLVLGPGERYWIFDSVLDPVSEDYSGHYEVYSVEASYGAAVEYTFEQHCRKVELLSRCTIPVREIAFDRTRRKSFSIAGSANYAEVLKNGAWNSTAGASNSSEVSCKSGDC